MERLKTYLTKELPHINIAPLLACFSKKRKVKKGELLVKAGERAHFLAFVNRGSFRVFLLDKNGNEITTWFGFQDMWVTDLFSYYKNTIAVYNVEAMEDSEVISITKNSLNRLYKTYPEFLSFAKEFAEYGMIMMIERAYDLQVKTAEQRYKKLFNTPILEKHVPLKYIASYIGVTESSLSRIRKNCN